MAFRGIDLRETGDRILIRAMLEDSAGDALATGTTVLRLYEYQSTGSLKSYDFDDDTFKATALTTETLALTHRTGNNGTVNTGIWTAVLTTLTGFTAGNLYCAKVTNTAASPVTQTREFQFGAGSAAINPYDGVRGGMWALPNAAFGSGAGALPAAVDADGRVDVGKWLGTAVTVSATTAKPQVDVLSLSDDSTAANNLEAMLDGTGGVTLSLSRLLISYDAAGPALLIQNTSEAAGASGLMIYTHGTALDIASEAGGGISVISSSSLHEAIRIEGASDTYGALRITNCGSASAVQIEHQTDGTGVRIIATTPLGAEVIGAIQSGITLGGPTNAQFEARSLPSGEMATSAKQDAAQESLDALPTAIQDALDEYGAAVPGSSMALTSAERAAIAAVILATPSYKLKTNVTGQVEYSNPSPPTVEAIQSGLATTQQITDLQTHGDTEWATGTSAGSGARTVTVIVTDGTDPLESARVRFTKGAESYVQSTNASGQVVLALDDGTWSVAISLAGHTFTPTTLVVDGDETVTYSMTLVTVTPSDPGFVTGYFTAYDNAGDADDDASVTCRFLRMDSGTGYLFDTSPRTALAGSGGLVEFVNLVPDAYYVFKRGNGEEIVIHIPSDATDPYALDNAWGKDA